MLPIVQEGVENTHYVTINYSKPVRLRHILVRNGQKTCTITALVLRICTAVILLATLMMHLLLGRV
jgi:hypothetical protein